MKTLQYEHRVKQLKKEIKHKNDSIQILAYKDIDMNIKTMKQRLFLVKEI